MGGALYETGQSDERARARREKAHSEALRFGLFAARSSSPGVTYGGASGPSETAHGSTVVAGATRTNGPSLGSGAAECLVTVKPSDPWTLSSLGLLDILTDELSAFARRFLGPEGGLRVIRAVDRLQGEAVSLNVDGRPRDALMLKSGLAVGIVCRVKDRVILWIGMGSLMAPTSVFTKDMSSVVQLG